MKKVDKPTDEVLRSLIVDQRLKLSDIGKIYGVRHSTISNWKASLGIQPGIIIPFTKEDIVYHYSKLGKTQSEIGDLYQVSQNTIGRYMEEWDIPILPEDDRIEILEPVNLSPLQEDFIRGTILGDAHLRPFHNSGSGKNSIWVVEHGDRQRNYLKHCGDELKPWVKREPYRYWRKDSRFKKGGTWSNGIYSSAHKFWTNLREIWYPQGIKIIPPGEILKLNATSLSYWFADDGTRTGMAANLYTNNFTREEVEMAHSTLKQNLDLKSSVKLFSGETDQFYIHFDRNQAQELMAVIGPTLKEIPDMSYKTVNKPQANFKHLNPS